MVTPQTGDRRFDKTVVRIADLTLTEPNIDGYEFSHCRILGPAILLPLQDVGITGCSFDAPFDVLFWEIDPRREAVTGAVGVSRTTFSGCTFEAVGLAGPPDMREFAEKGFSERQ